MSTHFRRYKQTVIDFFFRPTAVHPLTATVRSLLPVFTLRSRLRSWLAKNLLPQASPKLFFQDPTHTQTSKWVTIKSWWSNPKAAIIPQKLPHQYLLLFSQFTIIAQGQKCKKTSIFMISLDRPKQLTIYGVPYSKTLKPHAREKIYYRFFIISSSVTVTVINFSYPILVFVT